MGCVYTAQNFALFFHDFIPSCLSHILIQNLPRGYLRYDFYGAIIVRPSLEKCTFVHILFLTCYSVSVPIFKLIGPSVVEILGGGGHNAPPPRNLSSQNSPGKLGLSEVFR